MSRWNMSFLVLGFVAGLGIFGSGACSPHECADTSLGGNAGSGTAGGAENGGRGGAGGAEDQPTACNYSGSYTFCADGVKVCEICLCEYARCTVSSAGQQNIARVGYCVRDNSKPEQPLTCSEPCDGSLCH